MLLPALTVNINNKLLAADDTIMKVADAMIKKAALNYIIVILLWLILLNLWVTDFVTENQNIWKKILRIQIF